MCTKLYGLRSEYEIPSSGLLGEYCLKTDSLPRILDYTGVKLEGFHCVGLLCYDMYPAINLLELVQGFF